MSKKDIKTCIPNGNPNLYMGWIWEGDAATLENVLNGIIPIIGFQIIESFYEGGPQRGEVSFTQAIPLTLELIEINNPFVIDLSNNRWTMGRWVLRQ